MQKIIFKLHEIKNRKTGKISYTWKEIHTNKNKVNHKYNSKSSRSKMLSSYIDKIKNGEYEIVG